MGTRVLVGTIDRRGSTLRQVNAKGLLREVHAAEEGVEAGLSALFFNRQAGLRGSHESVGIGIGNLNSPL